VAEAVAAALDAAPSDAAHAWAVQPRTRVPEVPHRAQRWSDPWGSNLIHLVRFTEPIEHSLIVNETTVGGRYVRVIEVGVQSAEPDAVIGDLTMAEVDPDDALAHPGTPPRDRVGAAARRRTSSAHRRLRRQAGGRGTTPATHP
jgi:hypothetical protein